jgi:hypothetical protein
MQQMNDHDLEQLAGGFKLACALSIAGVVISTAMLVTAFGGIVAATGGLSTPGLLILGGNYAGYVVSAFSLATSC